MPPVNLPEDGLWLQFFLSIGTAWGRWACGVFYWVSSVRSRCLYNHARFAKRAGKKRERELSFQANRPLLYSSVGSLSGQTPFWCFRDLR